MRRITDLEKKVARMEGRKPFQLRYFIRITLNPGHDVFDRAEAGGEYFIREEGESEREFCDRITGTTDTNPIRLFPQSHETKFIAQRTWNATQQKALPSNVSKSESGSEPPDPTPTPGQIEIGD